MQAFDDPSHVLAECQLNANKFLISSAESLIGR